MSTLAERYAQVKARLRPGVELVAVSKTRTVAEIQALYDLGHRDFGENYPQELRAKQPALPADIRWHFIGHLQRSNVKHVLPLAHLVHGVDSARLLDEVEKRAEALSHPADVLLQVHIAQEDTKHGFSADEVQALLLREGAPATRWPHVRIRGLMGMATNTDDTAQVASEFRALSGLFQAMRTQGPIPADVFSTLSMGMSSDADLAMAAGSTLVRIGTAIFGERG
ncbi:MAG: YggS family pyridoxal phosphate-dependent enzyme [Flavobacteriales bacterium]